MFADRGTSMPYNGKITICDRRATPYPTATLITLSRRL
jgi:hypothetical protein